jgi:uncharacterized protein YcbX
MPSARLDRIRVHPVKGFAGAEVETAHVADSGTLEHDREFALYDDEILNGKNTDCIYGYSASVTKGGALAVESPEGERLVVGFDDEGRREFERWLDRCGVGDVTVLRDGGLGFVDRRDRLASVSVISTATLREVASWFDGIGVNGVRRRMRMNLEVEGVPPFWEDSFADEGSPEISVGGVHLKGVEPCNRCVVPTRDPDTGEAYEGFRADFADRRRRTLPDTDAFDRSYTVGLICRVADRDRGSSTLRVGDLVETR